MKGEREKGRERAEVVEERSVSEGGRLGYRQTVEFKRYGKEN